MDTIVLTTEDSDFIANVIREEINAFDMNYQNALKEGNRRAELAISTIGTFGLDESDKDEKIAELKRIQYECTSDLNKTYNELMGKYVKCIELLLCGSQF